MNTELFTVSKIFTESIYRIPDYQRGYSWREEQLKDFWLDLEQLETEHRHYTGVLTLETVSEDDWKTWEDDKWIIRSRRYKPYYVVDGQQRLTTVIILLQCILEYSKAEQLNFTRADDIRRKYIFDSKPEDPSRSYIFGYEKDNPSYEFLKRRIFCEESDRHAPNEDTIYTKNLLAAKKFFQQAIEAMAREQVEILFTKVTQQLVFNVYEISTDIDVFVTFETMNNRGKLLSTLELLKNRLIFLSTKIPAGDENGFDLRRAVNDAWKTAYHYLGKNDERPLDDDDFLRTHLSFYFPIALNKIPEQTADGHEKAMRRYIIALENFNRFLLNNLFTPKRLQAHSSRAADSEKELPALTRRFIYDYSQHLKTSVETYFKLSTPEQSSFSPTEKILLERIGRLRTFRPSNFLLALYTQEKDVKKRANLLAYYERMLFCQSLVGRSGMGYLSRRLQIPDFYLEFISGRIPTHSLAVQLENTVTEMFRESPLAELIHDWVKNGPSFYEWRSVKYLLFEYELELQERSRSSRQKLDWAVFSAENYKDDYETIEHIYPQRARDPYWVERFKPFTSTQKRLLRNSLGNLLPLAKPRNSSLGNKSFPEKLGDEKSMTGYRYGCYSENEVALAPEWGPNEIIERGVRILNFLEKRWKLPIGDRSQKLKALGLSFIKEG